MIVATRTAPAPVAEQKDQHDDYQDGAPIRFLATVECVVDQRGRKWDECNAFAEGTFFDLLDAVSRAGPRRVKVLALEHHGDTRDNLAFAVSGNSALSLQVVFATTSQRSRT